MKSELILWSFCTQSMLRRLRFRHLEYCSQNWIEDEDCHEFALPSTRRSSKENVGGELVVDHGSNDWNDLVLSNSQNYLAVGGLLAYRYRCYCMANFENSLESFSDAFDVRFSFVALLFSSFTVISVHFSHSCSETLLPYHHAESS